MVARLILRRSRRAPVEPLSPPPELAAAPAKPAVNPRVRKKAVKVPPRLFARWAVCDNAMRHVAVFEYRDRVAAAAKLADLLDRKTGGYFLLLVKQPRADGDPPIA
jgi:hypothetical protein